MSLYPQSASYGQQAYPPMAYGQPRSMPGPSYQFPPAPPPAQQPVYHVDPNTFRRDYTARLAELTVNSRPVIQSLSMMAQEYSRWADIIAQCIEAHIRRVPPWMKLPAFYVLDAISKNVYDPYARAFTSFVAPLFLESYAQVDPSTRSKMEEMLLTWRTGAPNGKELFGVGPQVSIERGIWGGNEQQQASTSHTASSQGQISKNQVLSELEFTLGQKQRAVQSNPFDGAAQGQINALQQLRGLVESGVSQVELRQILSQLRTMAPPPPPPQVVPPPQQFQAPPPPPTLPHSYGTLPPPATHFNFPASTQNAQFRPPSTSLTHTSPPPNLTSVLGDTAKLQGLFSALIKAGVVPDSKSGTPLGAGSSSRTDVLPSSETNHARDVARAYRHTVLSHKIKLTSADITRQKPVITKLMYERLPAQCKQCGIRFPDGDAGKKDMDDHLDMHFRQNRKASQNAGRGHNRSWFISIEDWLHDGSSDVKGKGRADGGRRLTVKEAAAADAAKRDAELRAMHVVVPPGDEAKPIKCPICKELMKSEFLEDDEEWVWRNAIKKDEKIYHATCHAEALASSTALAARLRSGTSSRSRSNTPDKSVRATPVYVSSPSAKVAGMKRKADHEDPSHTMDGQDGGPSTPPMKKLAIGA